MSTINDYYSEFEERDQKVTVFVLTHKRPILLKVMIDSVLKQTYTNFYLIILDNMSGDETRSTVENYEDDRVIYIEHEGSNFRYAFSLVRTKYLVVLHDDDYIAPNYLSTMIEMMEDHERIDALTCSVNIIDENGNITKRGERFDDLILYESFEYLEKNFIRRERIIPHFFPTAIYRKSFFPDISLFLDVNAGPLQDQFLWFEIGRRGGITGIIGQPLYYYRQTVSQQSSIHENRMELIFLRYLYSNSNYSKYVIENNNYLYMLLKVILFSSIKKYASGQYTKADIKDIKKLIPNEIKTGIKNRLYCSMYQLFVMIPGFFKIMYSCYKKAKGLFINHK